MPNTYFQFQQFRIDQKQSGMKVTTDACLFGAWVADQLKQAEPATILDIGAGTGLLSLMVAQESQSAQVCAVEINTEAFAEAKANFERSSWNDRLKVFHQSIEGFSTDQSYEVIMSNPPFFQRFQQGRTFNKNQALHASQNFMETLAQRVNELLSKDGTCYLLYPTDEMTLFTALASSYKLHLTHKVNVLNRAEQPIFRTMAAFKRDPETPKEEILIIRRPDGKYSDHFWRLLKGYYLAYNDPNTK